RQHAMPSPPEQFHLPAPDVEAEEDRTAIAVRAVSLEPGLPLQGEGAEAVEHHFKPGTDERSIDLRVVVEAVIAVRFGHRQPGQNIRRPFDEPLHFRVFRLVDGAIDVQAAPDRTPVLVSAVAPASPGYGGPPIAVDLLIPLRPDR